jgi:hypothetical protein
MSNPKKLTAEEIKALKIAKLKKEKKIIEGKIIKK